MHCGMQSNSIADAGKRAEGGRVRSTSRPSTAKSKTPTHGRRAKTTSVATRKPSRRPTSGRKKKQEGAWESGGFEMIDELDRQHAASSGKQSPDPPPPPAAAAEEDVWQAHEVLTDPRAAVLHDFTMAMLGELEASALALTLADAINGQLTVEYLQVRCSCAPHH